MGFILPFWIALGAIPLAAFVSSTRTIAGGIGEALLRLVAFTLRLLGQCCVSAGKVLITCYDLIIFPTLWLESALGGTSQKSKHPSKKKSRNGFLKRSKKRIDDNNHTGGLKESR